MRNRSFLTLGILCGITFAFYAAVYLQTTLLGSGGNPHFFFHPNNLSNLLGQAALVGVLACGMTAVILAGHIDLSVGSLLGMLGACAAWLLSPQLGPEWPVALSLLLVLGIGAALGALHGVLTAYFEIPSFVVTLGGLLAYRGVLLIIAQSTIPVPAGFVTTMGSGTLSPRTGWIFAIGIGAALLGSAYRSFFKSAGPANRGQWIVPLIAALAVGMLTAWLNQGQGIPIRFAGMLLLAGAMSLFTTRTRFGRYVYAIGGNREAAVYSGIRVERILVGVFALMGVVAALAGILLTGFQMAADAGAGDLMELYAIAACVIGGTSLRGGRGTIWGSIIGALIMATIRNGLSCLGVASSGEKIILGIILIFAVGVDLALSRRKAAS